MKESSLFFTFWYCVHNFYPWKYIVRNKVSNLRSIAELRAFYGTELDAAVQLLKRKYEIIVVQEINMSRLELQR